MPVTRLLAPSAPATGPGHGWRPRWRRLRQARWFRSGKLFLKRLIGREPWLALDVKVPLHHRGDWAFSTTGCVEGGVAYALGVGVDLGLERELVQDHGMEVHAFDPSPECLRWIASQHLRHRSRVHLYER
ncbi:MAG: hypothetical protein IT486_11880 [Gammaproteobacteria bacterium]|nr:hypothetical protein [Gammaproteobacteria bacterium]